METVTSPMLLLMLPVTDVQLPVGAAATGCSVPKHVPVSVFKTVLQYHRAEMAHRGPDFTCFRVGLACLTSGLYAGSKLN